MTSAASTQARSARKMERERTSGPLRIRASQTAPRAETPRSAQGALDRGDERAVLGFRRGARPVEVVRVETNVGVRVVAVGMEMQARLGTSVEHAATLLGQAVDRAQVHEERLDAVEVVFARVTHGNQIRGCSTQR